MHGFFRERGNGRPQSALVNILVQRLAPVQAFDDAGEEQVVHAPSAVDSCCLRSQPFVERVVPARVHLLHRSRPAPPGVQVAVISVCRIGVGRRGRFEKIARHTGGEARQSASCALDEILAVVGAG